MYLLYYSKGTRNFEAILWKISSNRHWKLPIEGLKEIVLTGVNIGDYGKGEFGNKKHENTFLDLIVALDKIEALKRIRISSIEPNLLTDKVIDFVSQSRAFVPHFHLPLQSGNDEVLKNEKEVFE